jgi:hypothetical protein
MPPLQPFKKMLTILKPEKETADILTYHAVSETQWQPI